MIENLFCKIFVLTGGDRESVVQHVTHHLNGRQDGNTVECAWGLVDILKNDDADSTKVTGVDGFLYFPYLVETEPDSDFSRSEFISGVTGLLESLWANHYYAVAACDFEHELPRNGKFISDV